VWAAAGQLRATGASIRELRDLIRYRKRLIQAHASEGQRIQKTLEDAGSKLDSVAADVVGVSGRAMLAALVGGERDPQVLAELAKGRLRTKLPQLRQALRGRFGDHPALLVRLALGHLEHLEGAIAALDRRVDEVIAPFARARDQLDTITGVGKRAAETIIAEIGVDMTVFPTAAHLASWAGRCPGNNLNGGKRRSGKPTRGNRWLGEVLIECAWAAARSRDTYLSAQYWRLARRIGKKKAAVAVGHSILVIAWHLLTDNCNYQDLGGDYFVRRDTDRQRQRAVAQLQALGYRVALEPLAA
jgi:transposase